MAKYQLSSKKPSVVGKALPLRKKIPGRKIVNRPSPLKGNPRGVLPSIVKVGKSKVVKTTL